MINVLCYDKSQPPSQALPNTFFLDQSFKPQLNGIRLLASAALDFCLKKLPDQEKVQTRLRERELLKIEREQLELSLQKAKKTLAAATVEGFPELLRELRSRSEEKVNELNQQISVLKNKQEELERELDKRLQAVFGDFPYAESQLSTLRDLVEFGRRVDRSSNTALERNKRFCSLKRAHERIERELSSAINHKAAGEKALQTLLKNIKEVDAEEMADFEQAIQVLQQRLRRLASDIKRLRNVVKAFQNQMAKTENETIGPLKTLSKGVADALEWLYNMRN
ncbi:MAG: hypothetical protein K2X27_25760 [Candidatus Obscuribacterales bacterium]|nr:hypothetical protein [Candidatus Obscuribacterales bacterium]